MGEIGGTTNKGDTSPALRARNLFFSNHTQSNGLLLSCRMIREDGALAAYAIVKGASFVQVVRRMMSNTQVLVTVARIHCMVYRQELSINFIECIQSENDTHKGL